MSETQLRIDLELNGSEILTADEAPWAANEAARTMVAAGVNQNLNVTSSSTPVSVDQPPVLLTITISGTQTIDLTAVEGLAMPEAATRSIDLTSSKIVAVRFKADADNASAVNVAPGASNPYPLFGTANDIDVEPGEVVIKAAIDAAAQQAAVAPTVKEIDVSGTNGDVLTVEIYAGS